MMYLLVILITLNGIQNVMISIKLTKRYIIVKIEIFSNILKLKSDASITINKGGNKNFNELKKE